MFISSLFKSMNKYEKWNLCLSFICAVLNSFLVIPNFYWNILYNIAVFIASFYLTVKGKKANLDNVNDDELIELKEIKEENNTPKSIVSLYISRVLPEFFRNMELLRTSDNNEDQYAYNNSKQIILKNLNIKI